jgi:fermentation-respiration switch protein FrsA (DUF1100 family)
MGAAAALLAAAETPEVAAVISDSSFLSFKDTTDHHVKILFRVSSFPLAGELRFFIERRAGFEGEKLDALAAVKQIGDRPILFIAGAQDKRMPPEIASRLYDASSSPKRDVLIVDGEETRIHGHAYQAASSSTSKNRPVSEAPCGDNVNRNEGRSSAGYPLPVRH